MVGGASKKMITERLKHLEEHRLISRTVLETRPVGVAYEITPHGKSALVCLDALRLWSETHTPPSRPLGTS